MSALLTYAIYRVMLIVLMAYADNYLLPYGKAYYCMKEGNRYAQTPKMADGMLPPSRLRICPLRGWIGNLCSYVS